MSNRNFDASVITKRLGNKAIAKSIISNFNNVNSQPQTSNMNASIINEVELGNSLFVTRGPTCTTYDLGCPCPISTSVTSVIPQTGWFTRIAGTGNDFGYGVARDSLDNIIVIGVYETADITIYNIDGSIFGTLPYSGGNSDAFLVKYNSNGTAIWATRIAGIGNDFGYSVAVDSGNNIIITGYYTDATTFYNADGSGTPLTLLLIGTGTNGFIVKYNSSGVGQWATRIAGSNTVTSPQPGQGVSVDSFDNSIIVTGYYRADVNGITIYNATPLPSGSTATLSDLLTNGTGVQHVFIVKYNSSGIGVWATRIAPTVANGGDILGLGVKVVPNISSAGDIIVTGSYAANATIYNEPGIVAFGALALVGGIDVFIVKYIGTTGAATWATRISGTGTDRGYGVAVDSSKNIIVTGIYTGIATIFNADTSTFGTLTNSGGIDAFIVKYIGSTGFGTWATRIAGNTTDRGHGIVVDSLDNIIVTGLYSVTATTIYNAPGGTVSTLPTLTNSGTNDVFIVKYNSSGIGQWATRIAGTADDTGNSITVDSNNNIIVTGYYSSSPVTIYNTPGTLVAGTLVNSGGYDVFLVKYTSNGFI